MRTRNSYYPNNSIVTISRRQNKRRAPNVVEPDLRTIIEVAPMADNRTMEELLQAPTKGYGEAIAIPEINADHFEIKTNLLQLVQANPYHGFERENPHTHINNFKRNSSTLKFKDVLNDVIKLMMFPYSLEGAARVWYDKEPPNSIWTWDDLINKFVNQFFPPSKTTHLKNEISRFTQRFEETFGEACEQFKEMLRAYSLNAASGGNHLSKTTREALNIIENKSKVRYSRYKPNVSRMNMNSRENASKTDDRIDKLADQISTLVDIFAKKVITPATVKAVEESCVTCGGPHVYYNCVAFNSNQSSVCVATSTYNQVAPQNRASNPMAPLGFAPVKNSQNREEYAQKMIVLSKNSSGGNPTSTSELIISDSSPSLTPFEGSDFILEEIKAYLKDESISPEIDHADCDLEYLEEQTLDDLFNSLKIYEAEVKSSSSASTSTQNIAFVSYNNTNSTNEPISAAASVSAVSAKIPISTLPNVYTLSNAVIYSFFASQSNSPQLDNDDLKQIDADDLEEMDLKWQMAMLTVRARKFLQRTGRNLGANRPTSMGFDMLKSFQAEEEPTNYALMAFTSSTSSSSDNENLSQLLTSQTNDKTGLGYNTQVFTRFMFDGDELFTSRSDESLPPSLIYDRYHSGDGYHVVPPLYTGTFMPPKPNLVFHNAPNVNETVHTTFNVELSPTKPENDLSHTHRPSSHIIEDWVSDSEDDSEAEIPQNALSFVYPIEQVKTPRPSVKTIETSIPTANTKTAIPKPTSNGNHKNRKACFVFSTKSKLNAARPITAVVPKPHVTRPRQAKPIVTKPHSPPRRNINHSPSPKASTFPPQVTAAKAPMVNAVKGKWEWKPKCPILDHVSCNTSALMTLKSTNDPVSAAAIVSTVSAKIPVSALSNMDTLRRNFKANRPTSMGFDMSKMECYNCHMKGHFVRECRSPKDTRRNAMTGVFKQKRNLPTMPSWHSPLQVLPVLTMRQKFEKAEQERDELKLKLEKFQTSSKNLSQLLASQTNDKTRLGYNTQVFTRSMFDCDEFSTSESDDSLPPSPIYDRLARKNELKARGTLLMALPDKHQLNFNSHKDAKTLMEAIEKRFRGNTETKKRTHTLIWRSKTDLEEQSLDDLFNSLKIYEAKVKSSSSIDADDLEEMDLKWQMTMLTVECYNCYKKGHFAKERSYDWSFQADEEPTSYALMAFTSSSSSSDNEHVETSIPYATSKTVIPKLTSNGKRRNRKACFVCKSLDHLIKDCDYHDKKMAQTTPRNTAQKGTHKQYAQMTLPNPQRRMVPTPVLTQSKLVPINVVRPVRIAVPKNKVTRPRQDKPVVTKTSSPPRRLINRSPSLKASNSPPRVTVVKASMVNAAKVVKGNGNGNQNA
nr:reverse transcriptase domain-containing protein [Tanacetum cinerariifolium]